MGYGRFAFFEQETKLKGIRQGLSPEVVVRDDEKGMYFVHEMTRPLAPFLQFLLLIRRGNGCHLAKIGDESAESILL